MIFQRFVYRWWDGFVKIQFVVPMLDWGLKKCKWIVIQRRGKRHQSVYQGTTKIFVSKWAFKAFGGGYVFWGLFLLYFTHLIWGRTHGRLALGWTLLIKELGSPRFIHGVGILWWNASVRLQLWKRICHQIDPLLCLVTFLFDEL